MDLGAITEPLASRDVDGFSQEKEKISGMKDEIGGMVARAREAGRSAVGKVGSSAQNTARLAQDSGRWLGQIVDEKIHDEPLILGAVGVAVGVAIGLVLPRMSLEARAV